MLKDRKLIDYKTAIVVLVILLSTAGSYWLIARPYFATKSCNKIALENTGYNQDSWTAWAGNRNNQSNYMFVYELCMQKEGINP